MYLFIENTSPEISRVLLRMSTRVFKKTAANRPGKRADLLAVIHGFLRSKKVSISTLKGICVVTGPGYFSYLRTAVSIANTIGWALGIPVVGVTTDECANDEELLEKGLTMLKRKKRFTPVMPFYGKEPNITKAKSQITSTK